MTIDESFARLVLNTTRIAEALEAIASSQGIVTNPADTQEQLDLEPVDNSHKKPAAIKAEKKKTAKKKSKAKEAKIVVGKVDDDEDAVDFTLKDIRGLLHKLQEQENQAAVKSILKAQGASTLGQVDEKNYPKLALAIQGKLEE